MTTTHTKEDVQEADLIIQDYTQTDLAILEQLIT